MLSSWLLRYALAVQVQHSMGVTAILLITTFLGNPTLHLTAKAESHGVAYSRFIEYCVSPSLWAHIVLPVRFPCLRLYLRYIRQCRVLTF